MVEMSKNWACALVENAGHSIYVTDKNGIIQYVNPAFEEMTGYSEEEAIGENPNLLQSGKHSDEFYEELWATILSGEVWHDEIINRRKNGEIYYVDQTISPVKTDSGEIEGFVAINVDITERKMKRNFIERIHSRVEDEHRYLSRELHDQVGHDLLYTRMKLREQKKNANRSGKQKPLEDVIKKIDGALNHIRNLSSLLRPPSIEQENLLRVLEVHADKVSSQHDVTIGVEAVGTIHEMNVSSEIRQGLYRVAQEAILNAVEHGDADQISIVLTVQEAGISLLIEDEGKGFDLDELRKAPLQEKVGIVGMRERVRLLNGNFFLESNPRQGTQVKVEVPLKNASEKQDREVSDVR